MTNYSRTNWDNTNIIEAAAEGDMVNLVHGPAEAILLTRSYQRIVKPGYVGARVLAISESQKLSQHNSEGIAARKLEPIVCLPNTAAGVDTRIYADRILSAAGVTPIHIYIPGRFRTLPDWYFNMANLEGANGYAFIEEYEFQITRAKAMANNL